MINKSLKYIKAGTRADKGNRIDIVKVEIIRIKYIFYFIGFPLHV